MSSKNPEFMLRDRDTGRIFGVHPVLEAMPNMEKVPFEEVYPEKCMPKHVEKKVATLKAAAVAPKVAPVIAGAKATNKPAAKKGKPAVAAPKVKAGLDLTTANIPKDPAEELESDLDSEISRALGEDATRGLSK